MVRFIKSILAVAVLGLASIASAQTTLNSTTLSAAMTATQQEIQIASATNVTAGDTLFVDREAMRLNTLSGTFGTVTRGINGTAARAHAASAVIYTGAAERFYGNEAVGSCTAADELYTPRIVFPTGNVYECTGGWWNRIGSDVGAITASFVQGGTAADALDTQFFVADREYVITKIQAVWGVAESTGAMDIQVDRLQGTEACAAGDNLLNAVIDATGTANTVATGTLTTTSANLLLSDGERLCVDLTATPNEVTNMVVTVTLVPR